MKKIIFTLLLTSLMIFSLSAEDFNFNDIISDETGGASGGSSALSVSGEASVSSRYIAGDIADEATWDAEKLVDIPYDVSADLKLDLVYAAERTELKASINVDSASLSNNLFDELSATWFGNWFTASFGYKNIVWGKGDKVHVVDLINPMDYSDFINTDYLDRKISQPMADFLVPVGMNGLLEVIYVPTFTPNHFAQEGPWVMAETAALKTVLTSAATTSALTVYGTTPGGPGPQTLAMLNFIKQYSAVESYLPNTRALSYGQVGVHYTHTLGPVDLGATYYFGLNRNPSVYVTGNTVNDIAINFDRIHVAGLEAAFAFAGFNLRAEGAFTFTEDMEGDNPEVINPSVGFIAGLDRGIPLHNLRFNFQASGNYILNFDQITMPNDVENGREKSETNLILNISDSFNHEKIKPEVSVVYSIEENAGCVKPGITFDMDGYFELIFSGTAFWGEKDTRLGQFDDNDYAELKASFSF